MFTGYEPLDAVSHTPVVPLNQRKKSLKCPWRRCFFTNYRSNTCNKPRKMQVLGISEYVGNVFICVFFLNFKGELGIIMKADILRLIDSKNAGQLRCEVSVR